MMPKPLLSSYWDRRRNARTHKVEIQGTDKYLLFTDDTLVDIHRQISAAVKRLDHDTA